ncbi:hypothetical protein COCON_G00205420 [Conger conger]|uniref:PDZ domain-containing protein n=1 Tax=Conger conger TaxID=82655 RepID=A0A9Q1CYZ3_CONCO|nr:hypothetical protein COCON_G00205420 [Conger conger]
MRRFLKSQKGRFSLRQSKSGTRSASKDFVLSMPLSNHGWPDDFGFRLGGSGPSYILSVEDGSSAHMAGLQAGDQVLEIEGQDVSSLNPQALAALAQKQKNLDIPPGPDGRFGFTIVGDCPLLVEDCQPNSQAGRSGLRAGDFVLEVNGIPMKQHETAAAMIKAAQGRTLRLGVLGMGRRLKRSGGGSLKDPGGHGPHKSGSVKGPRQELSSLQGAHPSSLQVDQPGSMQGSLPGSLQGVQACSQSEVQGPVSLQSGDSVRQDRKNKAVEFNKKIEQVLGSEPEVKEQLFAALKQYAAERKVDILASALPGILTNEEHRQLLEAIRNLGTYRTGLDRQSHGPGQELLKALSSGLRWAGWAAGASRAAVSSGMRCSPARPWDCGARSCDTRLHGGSDSKLLRRLQRMIFSASGTL